MITVGEAKRIAKDWVEAEANNIPNFQGAFLSGSVIWKNNDDQFPTASDLDIKILVEFKPGDPIFERDLRHRNISFKGITLEPTFSPFEDFCTAEKILANYGYAAHFTVPNILLDPSGELTQIHEAVVRQFPQKKWVIKRIEGARDFTLWGLETLQSGSLSDRMVSLNFAMWGFAQIPLHADLRPPTGRRCGIVSLEIMKRFEKQALHESLLGILGSRSMTRKDVERHFEDLSYTFDRVIEIAQAPSFGDYANEAARPVVIDGSWEMIKDGYHREAVSWISVMRAIFQNTILRDASGEEQMRFSEKYTTLLAELGLRSPDDFHERAEEGKQLLEDVMQVAEQIVETHEKIIQ
jgi:hypothetical protein